MRILLADDDKNKRERIISFLNSKYNHLDIFETKSYQSTLKEAIDNEFDLILLDMTMPTFDISIEEGGGRVRVFAGKEIIKKMTRRKKFIPVVIITQFETFGDDEFTFEELKKDLQDSNRNIFKEIIYYHNGLSGWQEKLYETIELLKKG